MNSAISKTHLLLAPMVAVALLLAATTTAHAASPGITGTSFNLVASPAYISQPDGSFVYSWGYGCNSGPSGHAPAAISGFFCNTMQIPGPTLIVTQGQTVSVTLTNNLPNAAGNTSILFPGFNVSTSGGVAGLLTREAPAVSCNPVTNPGCNTVTYTFTADTPGTRAYYSGTQGDLQVEMGLYGAIIVIPSAANIPSACTSGIHNSNLAAQTAWGETNYRLAAAAYNHPGACYDREYLFQFSEMDPRIHQEALAQSTRS
jgi:FtsP/CotA-like multicopper oxidase with cupredoxin domain